MLRWRHRLNAVSLTLRQIFGRGGNALDVTAPSPWQRVCTAFRRIFRSFESERTDEHATWILTVRVREDPLDGGWVAECVDLPGCFSQGDTKEEALYNISDAIAGVISLRMDEQLSAAQAESGGEQELKVAVAV